MKLGQAPWLVRHTVSTAVRPFQFDRIEIGQSRARVRVIGRDHGHDDNGLRVRAMPDDISPTREIAQESQHHKQPNRRRSNTHTDYRTSQRIRTHPKYTPRGHRLRPALALVFEQRLVADMVAKQQLVRMALPPQGNPKTTLPRRPNSRNLFSFSWTPVLLKYIRHSRQRVDQNISDSCIA